MRTATARPSSATRTSHTMSWSDLSQSDYTEEFEALPRPLPSSVPPGRSIHEAIRARNTTDRYCIYKYHALYHTRPLTTVTFRLLTWMLRVIASKFWNCSSAQQRRSCENLWQTCAWPGVSTTFVFHEYKDPHGNRLFAGHSIRESNGSVSFPLAQGLVKTRFQFQQCSTLTAHFSRKGLQFDLFTISVYISYPISCPMW